MPDNAEVNQDLVCIHCGARSRPGFRPPAGRACGGRGDTFWHHEWEPFEGDEAELVTDGGTEIDRGVSDIVCVDCGTSPRLKSLNKNDGTQTMCDCDDVRKSMDSVPYELGVSDLPESWVVIDGRSPGQMAREVDALLELREYECPSCGSEVGLGEGRVTCADCGFIPEAHRA